VGTVEDAGLLFSPPVIVNCDAGVTEGADGASAGDCEGCGAD